MKILYEMGYQNADWRDFFLFREFHFSWYEYFNLVLFFWSLRMSMDYNDIWELGVVSDCCNAGVYINGICAECKDHCTPIEEKENDEN